MIMSIQVTSSESSYQKSASYRRHKKQRLWQVLLPMTLAGLFLLAVAALVVVSAIRTGGEGSISKGADTALIWLIIPVMLFAILFVLILLALIILVGKFVHILPVYTFQAQHYVRIFSASVKHWSDKLVSPVISAESVSARVGAFFSTLFGRARD